MQPMWLVCALVLYMLAPAAHAQQACPWLTQGTAEKLMGGPVIADIHAPTADRGTCAFTHSTATNTVVLRIEAGNQVPAVCVGGDHLKGIGDEAVRCVTDRSEEHREAIQGHVRSTQFALTLTVRGNSLSHLQPDAQRSAAEQIAEEVAGSLF